MTLHTLLVDESPLEDAFPADGKLQLRLWLRLLTCEHLIEGQIRSGLRTEFNTTLPRFDLLAQLDAAKGVVSMGDLSTQLMVTSGNVTALVDGMEKDGLIVRQASPTDRRSKLIAMTPAGRSLFDQMAPVHQGWIRDVMTGLSRAEMVLLLELLGKLKESSRQVDLTKTKSAAE